MSLSETENSNPGKPARKNRAAEIANTLEWLITAFVLAFVFRAFIMEAFRIPTGSMADTLKGAHFRLCCQQCGYKYDHGFNPRKYRLPQDTVPYGPVTPPETRCPNCGYHLPSRRAMPVANGDRILVLKCIYQFFEPKQWDVIVFKNPPEPSINYIKRLIGLPGDTVEIIDGDIYIDGEISRKPPKVQKELWMPVYNNDYQPVLPQQRSFNGHMWQQPFRNIEDSKWITHDANNPTLFRLDRDAEQIHSLVYDTSIGNNFRATYAYDDISEYRYMPYCSDLMVRFYARSAELQGRIGIELSKHQTYYRAWFDLTGEMVITKTDNDGKTTDLIRRMPIRSPAINKATLVKFANVDRQLIFEFGSEKLTHDLGRDAEDARQKQTDVEPQVRIFGSGKLTLSHIALFRDIHYTAKRSPNSHEQGRATQGNAFPLEEDEFFVLGDNSPNSEDGRWWRAKGKGNNGRFYPEGIVPRDYLVGKALFVYWPSGFRPFAKSRFAIIPNVGRMRFIHGGSSNSP
jgi:signal peptidase I